MALLWGSCLLRWGKEGDGVVRCMGEKCSSRRNGLCKPGGMGVARSTAPWVWSRGPRWAEGRVRPRVLEPWGGVRCYPRMGEVTGVGGVSAGSSRV